MRKSIVASVLAVVGIVGGASVAFASSEERTPMLAELVPLSSMSVPIMGGDRLDGVLDITLVIEAKDPAGAELLRQNLPILRDACLSAAIEFGRLRVSAQSPVDAAALISQINMAARSKDPHVDRVLLTMVFAREA